MTSSNTTNTTKTTIGSDEERRNQLLLYTGLTCIGFLGALLLNPVKKPAVEEELSTLQDQNERGDGHIKSQRKKVESVRAQMKSLVCDPLFLVIASFNACCFSVSIYLHTQACGISWSLWSLASTPASRCLWWWLLSYKKWP